MELQSLHQTQAFLNLLASCHSNVQAADLLGSLEQALSSDGYIIQQLHHGSHRYLRGLSESEEGGEGKLDVVSLIMVVVCVVCAGFASGLTQGLLSLDTMEMEIKARSGTEQEKKYAAVLIPIISRHHLLLVTLMLWNACATEAMPIFLSALVPEYIAIIISVSLVLFVGEIIPASILTGPNQLQITAALWPVTYFVMFIFFPIAYPISLLLDYIIGHSGMTVYNRTEISTMMRLQREEGIKRASHYEKRASKGHKSTDSHNRDTLFEEEEVEIIAGALKFREMAVSEVMTPSDKVYMISAHEQLSYKLIYEIFKSGYSRIPVYDQDRNDVVGLILAKDLIFVDPEDCTPVQGFLSLFGRKPGVVWHDSKLGETLTMFKQEKSHMAVVRDVESATDGFDPTYKVVGIITLEDIVEEILGTEIEDETDHAAEDALGPVERDPELARLRTINNTVMVDTTLTEEEIRSIGIYLFTNVPQVQRVYKENMADLQKLVRTSEVITITRKAALGEKPALEDFLYRQGKVSNTCTLILSGEAEVSYEDQRDRDSPTVVRRVVTKGPWSTLAAEVLEVPEGTYVPDFTASIVSETLRYVRLANDRSRKVLEGVDFSHSGGGRRKLGKQQYQSMYNLNSTSSMAPFRCKEESVSLKCSSQPPLLHSPPQSVMPRQYASFGSFTNPLSNQNNTHSVAALTTIRSPGKPLTPYTATPRTANSEGASEKSSPNPQAVGLSTQNPMHAASMTALTSGLESGTTTDDSTWGKVSAWANRVGGDELKEERQPLIPSRQDEK